jgi:hypothetical protein
VNVYRTRHVSYRLLSAIEFCRTRGEDVSRAEREVAAYRHGNGRHERAPVPPVPCTPAALEVLE